MNNIIFTTDNGISLDKLNGLNIVHNIRKLKINGATNDMILIESAVDNDDDDEDDDDDDDNDENNMLQSSQIVNTNIGNLTLLNPITEQNSNTNVQLYIDEKKLQLQFAQVCRCCLTECSDMQNIFDDENCIADMIMAIAPIQVSYKLVYRRGRQ